MLFVLLSAFLVQAQPSPQAPRDAQPVAVRGTGVISGRVVAGDTGVPLPRANVALSSSVPLVQETSVPGMPLTMRNVATDLEGRFAFRALPAATYHVRVTAGHHRALYLYVSYGSRRPSDVVGRAIELKDGQRFDAGDILLPRGGAISGRVIDELGEPLARLDVSASMRMRNGKFEFRSSAPGQTDDQGRFRLYGLEPGEYVVSAGSRGVSSFSGPPVEGASEGFMLTYAPAAFVPEQAQRIHVEPGTDVGDVQIQIARTRTFKISGTVLDSKGRPSRATPMLARQVDVSGITGNSMAVDPAGAFSIRDVLPGDYTIVVRPQGRGPDGPAASDAPPAEFAEIPITITSDVEGLVVVTKPGVSITGHVVLDDGSSPRATGMRVSVQPPLRSMHFSRTPTATVGADLRFTLDDLFGPAQIRFAGAPGAYALKAVMLGATDITDAYTEFKPEDSGRLQIVLTSRVGSLEGTVSAEGDDADGLVVLLPEERSSWSLRSPRARVMPLRAGRFSATGLVPGTYYAAALAREQAPFGPDPGPETFERLVKVATPVVVAEGEKRTIELRFVQMPELR